MAGLFLDLGSTTGFALRVGPNTTSGIWTLKANRYEGGGMRFLRFRWQLDEMARNVSIKYAAYEEVRSHKGVDAAHIYGGLMGQLTSFCEEAKIPYEGVPVGSIKKHVTGKGNAGKPEVIAGVRKFGFEPIDDNEADAIALMLLKLESAEIQKLM